MPFCTNCGASLRDNANFCVMCGQKVKKLIGVPTAPKQKTNNVKNIHLRVHGTSYHEEEINSLIKWSEDLSAKEIKDEYDDYELIQFDHFKEFPVQLVSEPDNQYDPNAVKVMIDGVHVGYIGKTYCAACKRRLDAGQITKISVEIIGGNCAKIYPDESTNRRRVERFYKQPYIMLDYWYNE